MAVSFGNRLNAVRNRGDVFPLRDDKRDEHLPRVLPQHANATATIDSGRYEVSVRHVADVAPDGFIFAVHVEIIMPYVLPCVSVARNIKFAVAIRLNVKHIVAANESKCAVIEFMRAETLTAVYNLA